MAKHSASGQGNADQGSGKHRAGKLKAEETTMPAAARAQANREGGYDVGGKSATRAAQRGSDSGQTHSRD